MPTSADLVTKLAAAGSSNQLLAEVFREAPSFMAVLRGPEHVVELANERFFQLVGRREILGRPAREAFPEAERRNFVELLDDVYQTGRPVTGAGMRIAIRFVPDHPPETRYIEFDYQPLRDSGEAGSAGVVVHGVDLTGRNRAEEGARQVAAAAIAAAKANVKFRYFFEQGTNFAGVLKLDGTMIEANRLCLDACGYTREGVIGKPFWECGWWNRSPELMEMVRAGAMQAAAGEPFRRETSYFLADGSERFVDLILAPVSDDDGRTLFVAATGTDVTERTLAQAALREHAEQLRDHAEQLRDADRRKDEFLAMLAHELRNPLAPICSGLDLLRLSGAESEVVDVMGGQVEHLVRLVDDLLDVARIVRGKVELRTELTEVRSVLGRAVEVVKPMIDAQRQTLDMRLAEEAIWIDGDPVRLTQVVSNLLSNASKYGDAGGRIGLFVQTEANEVILVVSDDGIGIEPDLLPRVFDLFTQARQPADRPQGGLGIGLTVVRSLIEMHGGTVAAASGGPGQGSEFIVRLPCAKCPPRSDSSDRPDGAASSAHRILVVDDNAPAAMLLQRLLEKLGGHEVVTANDGPTALSTAERHCPDLILLDIGLPGYDGYEVARRLRSRAEFAETLLVALTGYGSDEDRRRSAQAGFDEHLVKPPSVDLLRSLLSHPKLTARSSLAQGTPPKTRPLV